MSKPISDVHPSPFIEERVEQIRTTIVRQYYAMLGILDSNDHAELYDKSVGEAFRASLGRDRDSILEALREIETCTDALRETGIEPVSALIPNRS